MNRTAALAVDFDILAKGGLVEVEVHAGHVVEIEFLDTLNGEEDEDHGRRPTLR